MLDIFNIPGQQDNVKIYYAQSGSNAWQTWTKPRGCKYIWIMCIGGGSGGTAGTGSALTSSAVATGGGSGATVKALFPANVLPDILYVQPGLGGRGGVPPSGTSTSANRSFVSIAPTSSIPMNLVVTSGAAAASANGAETVFTTATYATYVGLLSLGTFFQITAGGNGGTTSFENRAALGGLSLTLGGCAGGAVSGSASPITGGYVPAIAPYIPSMSGGTATNINGDNGLFSLKPLILTSGGGGYGGSGSFGGNGGDGAFGCGGGGGGHTSAAGGTGGTGGKGGDGLVIIATF